MKRALLTYDRVIMCDPSDRDLIPPNAWMTAIVGLPFIGMNVGAVRPMGKVARYDDATQMALDECKEAVDQQLLSVKGTYSQEHNASLTIGAVPLGGYPLDPRAVFALYRSMAQDQEFLWDACGLSGIEIVRGQGANADLVLAGIGDVRINDIAPLPQLTNPAVTPDIQAAATQIARARLASFIKYTGYCEAKTLVPILRHDVYGVIAERVFNNCRVLLGQPDLDIASARATRVLQLCHEEYLIDKHLDALTVQEVLRLRTRAWGKQAAARERLFVSVRELAGQRGLTRSLNASPVSRCICID